MITGILVSAVRYWIEMKEKTKNGKPIRKPNDVRKILIRGDFTAALKEKGCYRTASVAGLSATIVKRKGEVYISVYALVKPAKPYWDHSPVKESELKRKPMDKFGFPELRSFFLKSAYRMPRRLCANCGRAQPSQEKKDKRKS